MGFLSLFILISSPFLTFGAEPFTFLYSVDTSAGNAADSIREERSQSPYAGAYSTYNQPAEINAFSYDKTAYNQQTLPQVDLVSQVTTFEDLFGFDLVEKTRQDTDALKTYLTQLEENEEAATYINAHLETNPCIDSVQDMISLLEGGARIIEAAGPELELMVTTLNSLRNERNITTLVRGSADLLVLLDTVFPKLNTFTFYTRCRSDHAEGLQSLRDQAQILYRMSMVSDFKFTKNIKDNLLRSAIITEVVTNFLDHFQKNLAGQNCFTQTDFLGEGTLIAAQTMDDFAEAAGVLGYFPTAKEARQYAIFTRTIVASMRKLKQFRITDDCSPGALTRGAGYMNDLANLIDEVGLLELGVNLGLVFRVDLLP